jgi:hypothetical protein
MIHEALQTDIRPMIETPSNKADLSRWGILPPSQAHAIMQDTTTHVIRPGLKEFGIQF